MRSLIVYESWFGNTRRVAEEIAASLAPTGQVDLVSVDEPLPPLEGVDLLVVGAPTHIHGLSSKRSREGALTQGAHGEPGIGMRGWIDALPDGTCGPGAVAFDTRAHKPVLLVGSAARGMANRLRRHGYTLAAEPESFFVQGTPGPLEEGELGRAAEWGKRLANEMMSTA
jgi:hypothetical protein